MKTNYLNDGFKNTGVSITASIEEMVLIGAALQQQLKDSKEYLDFYSNKNNITFFENHEIDRIKEIERCKTKVEQLVQMLQAI